MTFLFALQVGLICALLAVALWAAAGAGLAALVYALPWHHARYDEKPLGCYICLGGWGVIATGAVLLTALGYPSMLAFTAGGFILITVPVSDVSPSYIRLARIATLGACAVQTVRAVRIEAALLREDGVALSDGVALACGVVGLCAAWLVAAAVLRVVLPPAAHELNDDVLVGLSRVPPATVHGTYRNDLGFG